MELASSRRKVSSRAVLCSFRMLDQRIRANTSAGLTTPNRPPLTSTSLMVSYCRHYIDLLICGFSSFFFLSFALPLSFLGLAHFYFSHLVWEESAVHVIKLSTGNRTSRAYRRIRYINAAAYGHKTWTCTWYMFLP